MTLKGNRSIITSTTTQRDNTMTNSQKLQQELNEMNAKRKAAIKENTVDYGAPEIKRSYTYMKGVSFRSIA